MTADYKRIGKCKTVSWKAVQVSVVVTCEKPEMFIRAYKAMVTLQLEYFMQARHQPLERRWLACSVQQIVTGMVEGQRGKH